MARVEIQGLAKSYGAHEVLHNLSIEVGEGEFLTLLGPSGCGKTTTLRCVAGLERADGGEIRIGGTVVASAASRIFVPPNRRDIGMVFQSYALWPHMTVAGNIAYPLRMRRKRSGDIRRQGSGHPRDGGGMSAYVGSATSASFPAASSSGWRWRARWSPGRRCCCSTSRCPTSTPSSARACAGRSARARQPRAFPRSTSRTTRRRPSRCPTAWSCCAAGSCSRSARPGRSTSSRRRRSWRTSSARATSWPGPSRRCRTGAARSVIRRGRRRQARSGPSDGRSRPVTAGESALVAVRGEHLAVEPLAAGGAILACGLGHRADRRAALRRPARRGRQSTRASSASSSGCRRAGDTRRPRSGLGVGEKVERSGSTQDRSVVIKDDLAGGVVSTPSVSMLMQRKPDRMRRKGIRNPLVPGRPAGDRRRSRHGVLELTRVRHQRAPGPQHRRGHGARERERPGDLGAAEGSPSRRSTARPWRRGRPRS